jgi:hypothetical protein
VKVPSLHDPFRLQEIQMQQQIAKNQSAAAGLLQANSAAQTEPDQAAGGAQAGPVVDREEVIRLTAYSFYEARGRVDGHELEDWLKAEAQVAQAGHDAALAEGGAPATH